MLEEDEEDDQGYDTWICAGKGCESVAKVKDDRIVFHKDHQCQTNLQMEIYGELGGYIFKKESVKDGNAMWLCQGLGCKDNKKGCKIYTSNEGLDLLYPHTTAMHRCGDEANIPVDNQYAAEDDQDIFGLFD